METFALSKAQLEKILWALKSGKEAAEYRHKHYETLSARHDYSHDRAYTYCDERYQIGFGIEEVERILESTTSST